LARVEARDDITAPIHLRSPNKFELSGIPPLRTLRARFGRCTVYVGYLCLGTIPTFNSSLHSSYLRLRRHLSRCTNLGTSGCR